MTIPAEPAIVRRLWPVERAALAAHLLRLDACDRRLRFCVPVGDRAIQRYVHEIDWLRSDVLGCFVAGELRGAAELIRDPAPGPAGAEASVSVERACRGMGLGSALMGRLLLAARNRLVHRVDMLCLAENALMRRIARQHGSVILTEDGQVAGRIVLSPPTPASVLAEATAEGAGVARSLLDIAVPPDRPAGPLRRA